MVNYLLNLFEAYDSQKICITDLDIIHQGARIDYAIEDNDGNLHLWAGDPDEDKHAEEILMDKDTLKIVCEQIAEEME